MPGPTFNWSPQGPGWRKPVLPPGSPWPQNVPVPAEAYLPSYTRNWSPGIGLDWGYAPTIAHRTEAGGAMMSKGNPMSGMNGTGMGDMFVYPEGTDPGEFLAQQASSGAMPTPGMPIPIDIQGQRMEVPFNYDQSVGPSPRVGQMSWESGPAPWEQTALPNHMFGPVYPGDAPAEIAAMHASQAAAGDAKAVQAAQAAKIAADNAVRAVKAGAPRSPSPTQRLPRRQRALRLSPHAARMARGRPLSQRTRRPRLLLQRTSLRTASGETAWATGWS